VYALHEALLSGTFVPSHSSMSASSFLIQLTVDEDTLLEF
jgi:hypothetical protein